MTEQKPLNFVTRIKSLKLISHTIDDHPRDLKIDESKITFNISFSMSVNVKEKMVTIVNPISIFSDQEQKMRLGYIEPKGEFVIENFDEVKQTNNTLPLPIVATYVGVVISSARGMLSLVSKGTLFENAIIPIINPTAFLQQIKDEIERPKVG